MGLEGQIRILVLSKRLLFRALLAEYTNEALTHWHLHTSLHCLVHFPGEENNEML